MWNRHLLRRLRYFLAYDLLWPGAYVSFSGDHESADESQCTEHATAEEYRYSLQPVETQSFLVRIWREAGKHPGEYFWRGHVTEVRQAKRQYVKNFREIALFMARYLPQMGVQLNWRWRSELWLQDVKRRWRITK